MTLNEFLEVKEDYVERAISLADMWPSDPVELKPELKYMENLDEIVERTRHLREAVVYTVLIIVIFHLMWILWKLFIKEES
jgi:hypothetical protein